MKVSKLSKTKRIQKKTIKIKRLKTKNVHVQVSIGDHTTDTDFEKLLKEHSIVCHMFGRPLLLFFLIKFMNFAGSFSKLLELKDEDDKIPDNYKLTTCLEYEEIKWNVDKKISQLSHEMSKTKDEQLLGPKFFKYAKLCFLYSWAYVSISDSSFEPKFDYNIYKKNGGDLIEDYEMFEPIKKITNKVFETFIVDSFNNFKKTVY